jgi:BirA family biotin operon repressor/biotin-[acetyl-CoA-carboxylase] ligase
MPSTPARPPVDAAAPRLPPQYELHRFASVDSVVATAERLARDGAEEGTLVWADAQEAAPGRLGGRWEAPAGGFYAALVLRPEVPAEQVLQLTYVALLSLGRSTAELLPGPMTMRYRWPNDLLLGEGKVGAVWARYPAAAGAPPAWLVLGVALNPDVPCADEEPIEEVATARTPAATRLLERFCRHFLAGINRWDTHGFDATRREWLTLAEEGGDEVDAQLADGRVQGRFVDIDKAGRLLVERDGRRRRVPLSAAYPPLPAAS